ncbi:MAG: hypothetical protein QM764_19905 [Chitinophagaceae bacterium]
MFSVAREIVRMPEYKTSICNFLNSFDDALYLNKNGGTNKKVHRITYFFITGVILLSRYRRCLIMPLKTLSVTVLFLFILNHSSAAQKPKRPEMQVNAGFDVASYYTEPLVGFGTHLKFLWPVGKKNNAIVGTAGFDKLFEDFHFDSYSYTFAVASVGYRKSFKSFFVESKVGFGPSKEGDNESYCGVIGIEPGFQKDKFSFSLDYRFITTEGLGDGKHFHTIAFRVGYKILASK